MPKQTIPPRGDRCCNPFHLKKHKIRRGLRHVGEAIRKKFPEFERSYFCRSCRVQTKDYTRPIGGNNGSTNRDSPIEDSSQSPPAPESSPHTVQSDKNTVDIAGPSQSAATSAISQNMCITIPGAIEFTLGPRQDTIISASSQVSDCCSELGLPIVNLALGMLDVSPISKKRLKMSNWVENKIDRTRDVMKQLLRLPVELGTSDSNSEFTEMIIQLKEKFQSSSVTRDEKIQILTILPSTWSNAKVSEEFGASRWMVKKARKLCKEKGIMATSSKKLGRPLCEEIRSKIIELYEDHQVTAILPGKKDFVSIRDDEGQKVHYQKRLMLSNLKELYQHFKTTNPDIHVGFSSFTSLRPKHCILAGSSGTHTMCVCTLHQNMKLMFTACNLKKLTKNSTIPLETYQDCLSLLVCPVPTSSCYLSDCENCPDCKSLQDVLLETLEENDIEEITVSQWVSKPRVTLETHIMCVTEFVEDFCKRAKNLLPHHFIAKEQSKYLKSVRENLQSGEFLVICDFAENYAFIVQDAAPAFHWNNDQATIYPVVIYYAKDGKVEHKSLVIISDCLNHDAVAVHVFTKIVVNFIKTEINPTPSRIIYFSDGAPQQFKNFKNFINLSQHKGDFQCPAEWHFFATAHGKGACDGIGGALKRLAARASLQLPANRQILKPRDLFEWASLPGSLTSISKRYSGVEDYNVAKEFLKERFGTATQILNTQKQHCFIPSSRGMITKIFSASVNSKIHKIARPTGPSGE